MVVRIVIPIEAFGGSSFLGDEQIGLQVGRDAAVISVYSVSRGSWHEVLVRASRLIKPNTSKGLLSSIILMEVALV